MPRWASRLTLEITDVRVERLQEISEEDALAEGFVRLPASRRVVRSLGDQYLGGAWLTARCAYNALWDDINGDGAHAQNPWVWALTFTVHQYNVDTFLQMREAA